MAYPYPTYATPPPAGRSRRSSPAPVVFGALVLLASIVVGLLLLTRFATIARAERVRDFARFYVDGGAAGDVDVTTTGLYTVYYEFEGDVDVDGDLEVVDAAADPPENLAIEVTDDQGDDVGVRRLRQQFEYEALGRRGVPVAQVELDEPGEYVVSATGGEEPYAISIGRGIIDQDLSADGAKRAGLLVLVIGVPLGLLLLLWGLARNSRARRRTGGGPPGGAPLGGPGYPPQGWGAPPTWGGSPPTGWGAPAPPGAADPPFPGR